MLRYKWALLGSSLFGSWIYTLVVANRTNRRRDEVEDEVRLRSPINPDEMLELRAVNDISTAQLSKLPDLLARRGATSTATQAQLLGALRDAVGTVRDEYVVERMLMALPPAAGGDGHDTAISTASLLFLSSGPVAERLTAMHQALCVPGEEGVRRAALTALLDALKETGQLPVEQRVATIDEGKDALGVPRSYYLTQPVREYAADEWAVQLLPSTAAEVGAEVESGAPPAAAEGVVDLGAFVEMLTSEMVCVWGECNNIRERKRLQKQREEADEYARNPPAWQVWKWEVFAGKRAS